MSRLPASYDPAAPPDPEFRSAPRAGRVLCFAPHADDEVIGPGGALALHRRQGDPVRVVIATAGTAGDPDGRFAGEDLAALRRAESRAGLARLGVEDLAFWGYPDSCVVTPADLDGISARAAAEIAAFGPQVVYLPWAGERNSDHRALHAGVARALDRVGFTGEALGYEVWTPMDPDLVLDVSPVVDAKRTAIRCYATQVCYVDYEHVILGLNAYRSLLHQRGQGHAEAFQHLGGRP
jgi:LmbE family N-acetylglucosaminyl deacetylase